MRRRDFVAGVGAAAAWPLVARAQQPGKTLRIGTANAQPRSAPQWVAFESRLRELGYDFAFDYVQVTRADGWNDGYREVIAHKPDIVIAAGPENSLKAAVAEAGTLPIVMIAVDFDPIARRYAAGLAKPGGNLTGVYSQNAELAGKHLQLMKQILPDVTTATVFRDRQTVDYWTALQAAAPQLNVKLAWFEFDERPYDYDHGIANMAPGDRKFLIALSSPFFFLDRVKLAEATLRQRVPALVQSREAVAEGSLMSYGADIPGMWVKAAGYVDRIAKGGNPGDVPIEQPTKFTLAINLKTAKTLDVPIPPSVISIADEVIE
jgi:putative ABC transport system substrate-binding protein